jgi:hypothetical protein
MIILYKNTFNNQRNMGILKKLYLNPIHTSEKFKKNVEKNKLHR